MAENACKNCAGSRYICRHCNKSWAESYGSLVAPHRCGVAKSGYRFRTGAAWGNYDQGIRRRAKNSRVPCQEHTPTWYGCDGGCNKAHQYSFKKFYFGTDYGQCLMFCDECQIRMEMAKDWVLGGKLEHDDTPSGLQVLRLESALCGQAFDHARIVEDNGENRIALYRAARALEMVLLELQNIGVSTGKTNQVIEDAGVALRLLTRRIG